MAGSAFLLFFLEPLVAKRILPWFGGSSAVWSTCLVFYQSALLLGYFYARLLSELPGRLQASIHSLLLIVAIFLLPIGPGLRWKPDDPHHPSLLILVMLSAAVGLPFVLLSATTPLLQHWLARSGYETPYRLFSLSNFASLAALLSYPFLIEPLLDITHQQWIWSAGYLAFTALCIFLAWTSLTEANQRAVTQPPDRQWILPTRKAAWFALSACSSTLLLAVTNHLDENVAAVPLLWIAPLAIYLITFILSFSGRRVYHRALFLRLLAFALGTLGYAIYNVNAIEAVQISLPIFLSGLFICCMFCHGELYRLRPAASDLTGFYLVIAAGGACGAIFVGLIAPQIFSGIYELPLVLALTAALATLLIWREGQWAIRVLSLAVTAAMFVVVSANVSAYHENAIALRRSFYGSLRVTQSPHAGPELIRTLFHGTIEHGAQYLWPPFRFHPTTYYGPDSGIGILLRECYRGPKQVGIVGLGAGTLAAYGQKGDKFRFYEINQQIINISQGLFYYLRESPATVTIVEGDARLSLDRDPSQRFDVLVLDAFSGDAIPVHLLTREALTLYLRHLKSGGTIAFHVSNDFLDLSPVVAGLAAQAGLQSILVRSHQNLDDHVLAADWVIVTNNPDVLQNSTVKIHSIPIPPRADLRLWTDDYNNLLQILKTPHVQ